MILFIPVSTAALKGTILCPAQEGLTVPGGAAHEQRMAGRHVVAGTKAASVATSRIAYQTCFVEKL